MNLQILTGDCREVLKQIPDGSAQCCVSSPPYWGLRDYGHGDQIGLEPTPEAYVKTMVEVFREVKRVLRYDGTLWLNLGDSYARMQENNVPQSKNPQCTPPGANGRIKNAGLKPKDLVGIPWRVARALQEPYYTGTIKDVQDRIWLAAMIDAEGCMFIHKRKAGQNNGQGYERQNDNYGPGLEVANTSEAIVQRCLAIVGKGSICSQSPDQNNRRKQTIYRYNLRTIECRDIVREIYPHLVAKQYQARLLCGCPSSGKDADEAHQSLMALHNGGLATIDFPEPKTMFEPGWYLRSDIIWAKCNPMPESVTDRPTKSHEYIFLLTKQERYFYDAEAIKEPWSCDRDDMRDKGVRTGLNYLQQGSAPPNDSNHPDYQKPYKGSGRKSYQENGVQNPSEVKARIVNSMLNGALTGRNKRSVWTVPTSPYSEAHFATFPPDLIKPCILAGTKPGDTVLDPFGGSGCTGMVALELGRKAILIELNPDYVELAKQRCNVTPGFQLA